jgi:hypothetical protein
MKSDGTSEANHTYYSTTFLYLHVLFHALLPSLSLITLIRLLSPEGVQQYILYYNMMLIYILFIIITCHNIISFGRGPFWVQEMSSEKFFVSTSVPLMIYDRNFLPLKDSISSDKLRCAIRLNILRQVTLDRHKVLNLNLMAYNSVDRLFKSRKKGMTKYQQREVGQVFPIILDTGASVSVSPIKEDFIDEITTLEDDVIKGLAHNIKVSGFGTIRWIIKDVFGDVMTITTHALFIPEGDVRLFSPQCWFQENDGGSLLVTNKACYLKASDADTSEVLTIPYNRGNNLPMGFQDPEVEFSLEFGSFSSTDVQQYMMEESRLFLSVADETNQNLTRAQKELILWHWKFGHAGFTWCQQLLKENGGIIVPKLLTAASCPPPKCAACLLARQTYKGAGVSTEYKDPKKEMMLKTGHLAPGDAVSMDQYQSSVKGRLPDTYGKEKEHDKYTGGTIFVDHASTRIFIKHQVSLKAGETIQAKRLFEKDASQYGITVKHYHADNGIFDTQQFLEEIDKHHQTIEFCGVGAHHQNGIAERAIRTVTEWARAMILHAALHWPELASLEVWPFAMDHAVYIWNNLPKRELRISPLEIFSKTKVDHDFLKRLHVWGCPVYVLSPKLQDGKSLPKWNPRSSQGQYLGLSDIHSSTIGLILNLRTGYISPQFHVVYDDLFQTVSNVALIDGQELPFNAILWDDLMKNQRERYIDDDEEYENVPELHEDWLEPNEIVERQQEQDQPFEDLYGRPRGQINQDGFQPEHQVQEPVEEVQEPEQFDVPNNIVVLQDEDEEQQIEEEVLPVLPPVVPFRRSERLRRPNPRYNTVERLQKRKIRQGTLNNQFLMNLDWHQVLNTSLISEDFRSMSLLMTTYYDEEHGTQEDWHPMILASLANVSDNPNFNQATNGPDADGYWEAMDTEMDTLQNKMSWEVVQRTPGMKVLDSTWAFKCKRFPDGSVRKLKARFCVRGDQQVEGVDFFDTFAPVVQWSTIRLLLMVSLMLDLATRQVDYTAAFLHAPLDDEVYCHMPRGYRQEGKVLKLKRSLYGLRQSPKNFFEHLKEKLESLGFEQSSADPCLFIQDKMICITYVDDCLFYAPLKEDIDVMIERLRSEAEMELTEEDDVAGFLGVKIETQSDGKKMELTQVGLIDRIIVAMGLEAATTKKTPAGAGSLPKNEDGPPCNENFNYASVVGMLMYLAGHSRPDIAFAVHQCARYTHCPKLIHEQALKHIGRYLLGTRERGLIIEPSQELKVDLYVDAAFAGLWGYEDKQDPSCVKSRTGFVVFVGDCPVLWGSKMQTEIALSTMESEYIALSEAMKQLIVLKRLVIAISLAVQLDPQETCNIWSTVYEDNAGALILANMEPPRMTPRSKHYAIKYHWFREELKPNKVKIVPIGTNDQVADIFTKSLGTTKFEELRKKLMGW